VLACLLAAFCELDRSPPKIAAWGSNNLVDQDSGPAKLDSDNYSFLWQRRLFFSAPEFALAGSVVSKSIDFLLHWTLCFFYLSLALGVSGRL